MKKGGYSVKEKKEFSFTEEDIKEHKTMAGLSYFIFFLPLLVVPDSEFAKFHANQSLLLFIVSIAGSFVLGAIPLIGWLLLPVFGLFYFCALCVGTSKCIWRNSSRASDYWPI